MQGESPRQLHVFDALGRDDRGRVLSVAHVDLVPAVRLEPVHERCALVPVDGPWPGGQGRLAFDHDEIVAAAAAQARAAYGEAPDPARLIDTADFTLSELRRLHEAVLGQVLQRDTFRRRMRHQLEATGRTSQGTVGRPTELLRRRAPVEADVHARP